MPNRILCMRILTSFYRFCVRLLIVFSDGQTPWDNRRVLENRTQKGILIVSIPSLYYHEQSTDCTEHTCTRDKHTQRRLDGVCFGQIINLVMIESQLQRATSGFCSSTKFCLADERTYKNENINYWYGGCYTSTDSQNKATTTPTNRRTTAVVSGNSTKQTQIPKIDRRQS